MAHRSIPCYFIQTGVGNIAMRLRKPDTGAGAALTLHQIVTMDVPLTTIPDFNPEQFRKFYCTENTAKIAMHDRLIVNKEDERIFVEFAPGMN